MKVDNNNDNTADGDDDTVDIVLTGKQLDNWYCHDDETGNQEHGWRHG